MDDTKRYSPCRGSFHKSTLTGDSDHTGEKSHRCNICGRGFILVGSLKIHFLSHAPQVPYNCLVCGRVYGRKEDLQIHCLMHTVKDEYEQSTAEEIKVKLDEYTPPAFRSVASFSDSLVVSQGDGEVSPTLSENTEKRSDIDAFSNIECSKSIILDGGILSPQENGTRCDRSQNVKSGKMTLGTDPPGSKKSTRFQCSLCKESFSDETLLKEHASSTAHQCETCEKFYSSCLNLKLHRKCHRLTLKCKVCNAMFATKQSLKFHALTHGKKEECSLCGKLCRNKRILTLHVNKTHKESSEVKCKDCGLKLKRSELAKHKLVHGANETHQCQECGVTFSELHRLWNHLKFKRHRKHLKCDICCRTLSSRHALESHRLTHTGEQECKVCGMKLQNENCLKKHMFSHESQRTPKDIGERRERLVQCDICGNMYGKSYIETHLKIHVGQKDFECYMCEKKFVSRTNLREHQQIHKKREMYKCKNCSKKYSTKKSLMIHNRKHTGETPHKCTVCSKTFVTAWTLKNHLRLHDLVEAFTCGICGKKFGQKKSLLAHYASDVHSKEELGQFDPEILNAISIKYQCNICGKNCHEKTMFTFHMRTHTGEKPHECKECGRTFRVASALKTHMKFHSGELKYKCKVCKKLFPYQYMAEKHEQLHNGERPHSCSVCGRAFMSKIRLKMHMERHTYKSVYSCGCCGQEFSSKRKCLAHQKSCSYRTAMSLHSSESGSLDSATAVEYYNSMDGISIPDFDPKNGSTPDRFVGETIEERIECSEYLLDCDDESLHTQVIFSISEAVDCSKEQVGFELDSF